MKPPVQIHVNNSYSRVTFQIKNGYHFELLTANSMKLLRITEEKRSKGKSNENISLRDITEGVLVHFNIVNNQYLCT